LHLLQRSSIFHQYQTYIQEQYIIVSAIYELIRTDWNKYGLDIVKGDTLAQKLVVPMKGKNRERVESQ
jgi:hypothetical protein